MAGRIETYEHEARCGWLVSLASVCGWTVERTERIHEYGSEWAFTLTAPGWRPPRRVWDDPNDCPGLPPMPSPWYVPHPNDEHDAWDHYQRTGCRYCERYIEALYGG